MNTRTTPLAARFGALIAATALLAGCASQTSTAADDTDTATAAESVVVVDAWVKTADEGMSAAFGEITNNGDTDLTVVSASTEASSMVELHETVENESGEMMMRQIEGGFVIDAGDTLSLEPGGSHIMLMGVTAPIVAGDDVTFTLTFADDSTLEFTAPAKDYSGANETYEGDDMDMDMDSHEDSHEDTDESADE